MSERISTPEQYAKFVSLYQASPVMQEKIDLWLESEKSRDEQTQREGFYAFSDFLETSGLDQSGLVGAMLDWIVENKDGTN
jgi:hypothetical protein